jgi:hypothetical protein
LANTKLYEITYLSRKKDMERNKNMEKRKFGSPLLQTQET